MSDDLDQDTKSRTEKKRKFKTDAESYRLDFIMSDPRGRAFLADLLDLAHVESLSFRPDDERLSIFMEGERNIGIKIKAKLIKHNHSLYMKMLQEYGERNG